SPVGQFFQQFFHDGVQTTGADVFGAFVYIASQFGQTLHAVWAQVQFYVFGAQQGGVLLGEGRIGGRQNWLKILSVEPFQFHTNREAALQFGNQIRGAGQVKGARGNEQDVIGPHHTVFGGDGGAFYQRQQVPLHALAGDVAATALAFAARGDLVDLIQEY